jgi:Spx/MgsR family transcriptional regulator
MKKAFDFLQEKGVAFEFFDYKKQKPTAELLQGFLEKTELSKLVNKQGTTFRKMSDDQKEALEDQKSAIPILVENSSMIKRPVIVYSDGSLTLGFDEDQISFKIA